MEQTETKLSMSPEAIEEVKRLIAENNLPETAGVRVGVRGGGCSGFTYTLNFDKQEASGDVVMEFGDVRLFVDPKSLLYLSGTTLEYTSGLQGKGFQFVNPNASSTCGCGESFSV
jgi:iron-sulfur cluster assembly protein